ncbi:MAG TPA: sulfite exporter TauE/SafE family protein [Candidatus Binatia bacterium]
MGCRLIVAILVAVSSISFSTSAIGHPLGNFSISHYSAIHVGRDAVDLKYILDLAEIPTFQEMQENGITPRADDAGMQAYLARKAEILRDGLILQIGAKPLRLNVGSTEIIFPPGAGGLPTMKIGVVFKAKLDPAAIVGEQRLIYRDENFPGRAGWKEIIVAADRGVELISTSAPVGDRSRELSDYPTDLLSSPPQQLQAQATFLVRSVAPPLAAVNNTVLIGTPSARKIPPPQDPQSSTGVSLAKSSEGVPVQLAANRQATPRNAFTEVMAQKQLGWKIVLFAFAVAVGLGAFHALEPGHGKTLVAAYLVGSQGTLKHALLLGLVVTVAHTAGVYLLGLVTLYASNYIVPERLYPWIALVSGVIITVLGGALLLRHHRDKQGIHSHQHHGHIHHHHHGPHDHEHHSRGDAHHRHDPNERVSLKQLLALGISGGIIPCPAALVVLLSAVSMQRIGLGLLLICAFSTGLAAVLVAVGMLMVYARGFMARFRGEGSIVTRWLPLASSAFIFLIGVGLTYQALVSAGLIRL